MSKGDKHIYNPTFQWRFLHPRFWATWVGVLFSLLVAFMPLRWRDKLASGIACRLLNTKSRALKRARINIEQCFPEKSLEERESLLKKSFQTAAQFFVAYGELVIRSKQRCEGRCSISGEEHLFPLLDRGKKVIALVPHCWAIDYAGIMLTAKGYKTVAMIRTQKNPIFNWLIHRQRTRYGARVYCRTSGIKPFMKAIKEGHLGYYLPDEDLGPQHSVFTPFFASNKATMKGLGRLAALTDATVIPMLPAYNAQSGKYELFISPPLENFPSGDEATDALIMNQALESMIAKHPEQYMWVLNLLRTRPDGSRLY
ncbi:lauroyl-Kdo(2)-lipid IV(A) myristoyltransferase [Marinomonas rhizomae]|uniref:Lipid A biosynthesis acyltransferase n=1 Tax=Marinomonas rhizomae TaxID=491948 RepID=A0A366JDN0_9GAMM|nr:lauroyl-Kdo(2)-lipid IV(A) myristoyltransferase [Marinomonas rhizomae]RBP85091.1 lauroyl-KDO2-lipid IV(A) myristoyltransferase [Marinomonas rhizomae]RNF76201.1 lauroyl-Kdo(2)-lipid IV(A) myristoyltransferase [Marinomonas rhizomae]